MRDLLPLKPVALKVLDPWWTVQVGFVTEDDIKVRLYMAVIYLLVYCIVYNNIGKEPLLVQYLLF